MDLRDVHISHVPSTSTDVIPSPRIGRIDRCFRFYRARFHLIVIPIGIILAAIHLKFGIQYLGQCPIQPMINIYMIVEAATTLLVVLIALIGVIDARYTYSRSNEGSSNILARFIILIVVILTLILTLFNFAWLVVGSVWIFGAKSNGVQGSDSTSTTTYCQSDLYRAAFVLIIVHYITHIIIIPILIIRRICCKRDDAILSSGVAMNKI